MRKQENQTKSLKLLIALEKELKKITLLINHYKIRNRKIHPLGREQFPSCRCYYNVIMVEFLFFVSGVIMTEKF